MRKAISPLIATILLVAVALAIAGILWSWSQTFSTSELRKTGETTAQLTDCAKAILQPAECSYANNVLKFRVNSAGIADMNEFLVYVLDATDKAVIGNETQGLKAGGLMVVDSSKLANAAEFNNLAEPLKVVRVTPKQCPQSAVETVTCK